MYSDPIDSTTSAPCASLHSKNMGQACILRRLSHWLWPPPRTVASSPRQPAVLEPTGNTLSPNERSRHYAWAPETHGPGARDDAATTPRYIPSPEHEDRGDHIHGAVEEEPSVCAYPCKACQTWGVTCDRQRPRCAHCLDQQILCFYVAPPPVIRKTTTRKKRTRQTRGVAQTEGQSHLDAP